MFENKRKLLELLIKLLFILVVLVALFYSASRYIFPSIAVVNNSQKTIEQASIALPSSRLDFGTINSSASNTLHYYLSQSDGEYRYKFTLSDSTVIEGRCGYVTHNQIHKRVEISIDNENVVTCLE